ncbi:hypothetical protein Tco_0683657 [Tanacetum coccineum]
MYQDFYNSNLFGFDQFQPPQFLVNYPPQETNKEILQSREDLMEAIQAFLQEYDHIPPNEKCVALLLAEERFLKIKQTMKEEQNQPGVMQELLLKLMNDLQILMEVTRLSRLPFGVTPKVLSIAWERFGKIKDALTDEQYQQEDIQELMNPSTFDALSDHSEILSDSKDDGTSCDDDDFEDIEYVSLEEVNDVDQEEKEFDLEDILQIQDVILRKKLLNISRLITNIESLNDNPTPDHVLKSPSSFPIPVMDSDSFFEESDTSLSHLDNSLPEFEPFSDDTEETRSGSTTTHANNSLPEYDSFLFKIKPDQGELTNIVIEEVDTFLVPEDSIPPDVEISLIIETDAPVINNFDELNADECFDPGGGEIVVSQNVEDDDSFTFVIRTFLPFLTYPADSPLLLSTGSEDTIFDPDIST